MMDLRKIAKAAAIITFDDKDSKFFINHVDEFDLDPHWLGKTFYHKLNDFKFELCGMRKIRGSFCFIIKPEGADFHMVLSAIEFEKSCVLND